MIPSFHLWKKTSCKNGYLHLGRAILKDVEQGKLQTNILKWVKMFANTSWGKLYIRTVIFLWGFFFFLKKQKMWWNVIPKREEVKSFFISESQCNKNKPIHNLFHLQQFFNWITEETIHTHEIFYYLLIPLCIGLL